MKRVQLFEHLSRVVCPSWQHLAEDVTSPFAGTQLTVEIHPQDAMPQLLKKFSLAKRMYPYSAAQ